LCPNIAIVFRAAIEIITLPSTTFNNLRVSSIKEGEGTIARVTSLIF